MRTFLLSLLLATSAPFAAHALSVGIAPSVVTGDVDPNLTISVGDVFAEILSWEVSVVQTVKVTDPATVKTAVGDWSRRTQLGDIELDEAKSAARQMGVQSLVATHLERRGSRVTVDLVGVYANAGKERVIRIQTQGRDDEVLQNLRRQVVGTMDSLGINVPGAVRAMVANDSRMRWDAVLAYAKGLRAIDMGDKNNALVHIREAQRLAPGIPALQIRLTKLEHELKPQR